MAALFERHRWLLSLVAVYVIADAATAMSGLPGSGLEPGTMWGELRLLPLGAAALLIAYLLHLMVIVRPASPARAAVAGIAALLTRERLQNGLLALTAITLFAGAFTSFKNMIPVLHPFSWDRTLSEWSRRLHGAYPFEMLQPVFGHPWITVFLDRAYAAWFVLLQAVLVWQAFSLRDQRTRMQFLLSFFLCWTLLGTLLATLLSCAGPCFYARIVGEPGPYAPLMDYLRAVDRVHPLLALRAQDYLWELYSHGRDGMGSGISAMPSMHVSMAVLMALLGWRTGQGLGLAFSAFALIVLAASVELGWHYAPDGYASALLIAAIWWGSGRVLTLWERIEMRGARA